MVIGLMVISAIPTVTGVSLGVAEQRKENERKNDARRMAKFNIDVHASGETHEDSIVDRKRLVLRDWKVYIDSPTPSKRTHPSSHTAESFFIDYPELEETKHLRRGFGLVTSTSDDPPMLGWIYADKDTYELKYGNRTQSVQHLVGPWDWTDDERCLTLEGKSRFVAVEEEEGGPWAVYFDRDRDDLEGVLEEQDKLDNAFAPVLLQRNLLEDQLRALMVAKAEAQAKAQAQAEAQAREEKGQGQEQGQGPEDGSDAKDTAGEGDDVAAEGRDNADSTGTDHTTANSESKRSEDQNGNTS